MQKRLEMSKMMFKKNVCVTFLKNDTFPFPKMILKAECKLVLKGRKVMHQPLVSLEWN
jgi:hypothetical protein